MYLIIVILMYQWIVIDWGTIKMSLITDLFATIILPINIILKFFNKSSFIVKMIIILLIIIIIIWFTIYKNNRENYIK